MNEMLIALYDKFYIPLDAAKHKEEIEVCHRQLIERLGKRDRKLVLRIIDAAAEITDDLSVDSFIQGFQLAWKLITALEYYNGHPLSYAGEEAGAHSISKEV